MKMRAAVAVVALLSLEAALANASEESKRLQSLGLVEFHARRYQQAMELFDQAVSSDPDDLHARYYRAITRGELGDYDTAIKDLHAILAANPDFVEASLELGIALLQTGQYQEAVPWLEQAEQDVALEPRASMFLGLAYLRVGEIGKARQAFRRAGRDPGQDLAARYYQGVADYREGKWLRAREHFQHVSDASPDSAIGREAAAFLVALGQRRLRRHQVYGALGFEYDSNVILAPSAGGAAAESILDVSQQGDARTTVAAGGVIIPWRTERAELSVGYDFFQSLHAELRDFDLQDHAPKIELAGDLGPLRLGVLGRYDYYLLDAESFLQEASALPWMTIPIGTVGRTQFYYQMRRRDYKKRAYGLRDAFNHAVGGRQYFYLGSPSRYVSAGYQYDREDPVISKRLVSEGVFTNDEAEGYAYDGNELSAGFGWTLPADVGIEVTYAYRHERYALESSAFTVSETRRRDHEHLAIAAARKRLRDHLYLIGAYLGSFNDSNDRRFEYDRHIGSLAVEVYF